MFKRIWSWVTSTAAKIKNAARKGVGYAVNAVKKVAGFVKPAAATIASAVRAAFRKALELLKAGWSKALGFVRATGHAGKVALGATLGLIAAGGISTQLYLRFVQKHGVRPSQAATRKFRAAGFPGKLLWAPVVALATLWDGFTWVNLGVYLTVRALWSKVTGMFSKKKAAAPQSGRQESARRRSTASSTTLHVVPQDAPEASQETAPEQTAEDEQLAELRAAFEAMDTPEERMAAIANMDPESLAKLFPALSPEQLKEMLAPFHEVMDGVNTEAHRKACREIEWGDSRNPLDSIPATCGFMRADLDDPDVVEDLRDIVMKYTPEQLRGFVAASGKEPHQDRRGNMTTVNKLAAAAAVDIKAEISKMDTSYLGVHPGVKPEMALGKAKSVSTFVMVLTGCSARQALNFWAGCLTDELVAAGA